MPSSAVTACAVAVALAGAAVLNRARVRDAPPPTAPTTRGRTNHVVARLLISRAHPLLSRWLCVIEYTGKTSGRRYRTPTQYVQADARTALILVGNHPAKNWWRNFRPPGYPISITIRGRQHSGTATAHLGGDEPDLVRRHLETFLERFPRAAKLLPADPRQRIAQTCLVAIDLTADRR